MYVGQLLAAGLAKESTVGTLVTPPTKFIPYMPPESFTLGISLLEDDNVRAIPDRVYKVAQGIADIKGKVKILVEPENCGEILMGTFGTDTVTGSAGVGYTHTFTRLSNAQLPTYSWWFNSGIKYPQFTGCMVNKNVISIKAKEWVMMETDWVGLTYDNTGTSQTVSYSPRKPFVFNQAVIKVDGTQINNYDDLKITVDNMVKAEPALNGTIYPAKIYSAGMKVTVSASLFLEDSTQYTKFLNGTSASFNVAITSTENAGGSTPYSLTIDIPTVNYSSAPLNNPKDIFKVTFSGTAVYTTGSSKTLSAALVNTLSTSY